MTEPTNPMHVSTPYPDTADDTSDGTTAPKADPDKIAEHQPDLEPADDTPAELGDDTGVDHEGNDVGGEQA